MKKIPIQLLALIVLVVPFLWSCQGDEEINPDAKISALIDGQPWNSASATGVKVNDNITLTASSSNGRTLIIAFKAQTGTQTLTAIGDSTGTNIVPSITYRTLLVGGSTFISNGCTANEGGQITITSIDEANKTVTGTFSTKVCSINSSVQITEGKLNGVKYN